MKRFRLVYFFSTLFILFTMHTQGQAPIKNYEALWKKADELIAKGLPQSALTEVKNIYSLAKKEKQDAQVIKALTYMVRLQEENREDNKLVSIGEIEKELADSKEPVASILNSLLAGIYLNYYQSYRWQLYNRTATTGFIKKDISTWSIDDFHRTISALYLRSLSSSKQLQQISLAPYDAIISKGNVRHLRPTLFDLLAHRALTYFSNDERDISKPAYAFEIDQAAAFDPAADFVHRKFETKDSSSLSYKALLIYQQLIAFHLNDPRPDALIDVDLLRIGFVRSKSVHPDKNELYFNAINHIAHQYGSMPAAAQAWYLLALYHNQQADTYKPYGDSTYRLDRVKAREICERVLAAKDSSEGKTNCYNLLRSILQPSMRFSIEKVNTPGQAFRALITYRNTQQLYLRIIKADEELKQALEGQNSEIYWKKLIEAAPIRSWEQPLPDAKDLQESRAEIKIDALPAGDYILVAGNDRDLRNKKTLLGARMFYVSTIGFINDNNDFFVLNRDNGRPLPGASVQSWVQRYDYSTYRYVKEKGKLYKTDNNGFFRMDTTGSRTAKNRYANNSYLLDIQYQGERLFINELINDNYYYRDYMDGTGNSSKKIFLFTDRSIYRPGQTLYFKGIVLSQDRSGRRSSILTSYSVTLYLYNANSQQVDSLRLTSNEYGSFSGKITLPAAGLNGYHSLVAGDPGSPIGSAQINVEEYKRPKFYVSYEPVKGTYKVEDKITVTGEAKAYAGNNIDGATVSYRVVRKPRFIYPWLFSRWWQPPSSPMEIAHGSTVTDKDGKFTVTFTAIPDKTLDARLDPVFDYVVSADITDINGETRSGEQTISVSYKSLLIKTELAARLPADSFRSVPVRTENMNGQFEPATVKIRISKLREEKRLIRPRLWDRPTQFILSKEEYIKNFPYDEYDNETDSRSWAKEITLIEKTDSTRQDGTPLRIPATVRPAPGFYMIEITTVDKNGLEIKDIKYIELYDDKSKQLNVPQYLWTSGGRSIEPGEKTSVHLGTSADNLFVIQRIERSVNATGRYEPAYSFLSLNKEKKSIDFTAQETDRGGYGAGWAFVKHNRVYQYAETIQVPWSNKELTIEYGTYRDKTLPGSEETWKIRISGYKQEKIAAEMLASMYDASLDQFINHQWQKPGIWPSYYATSSWNGVTGFGRIESSLRPPESAKYKALVKQYDYFLFDIQQHLYYGADMANSYARKAAAPVMAAPLEGAVAQMELKEEADSGRLEAIQVNAGQQQTAPAEDMQIRKNFNETAFFFPDLRTDSEGAVEFSFTLPEALTRWKFQAMAHTRDLAFGYSSREIVTQKELMVQPNPTRFLREGDRVEMSAKIINLSGKELTGTAELQLFDATTNEPVGGRFKNVIPDQYFTVAAGQSEAVRFPVEVPYHFNGSLVWRIVARAGQFSDGEENMLPVLTNRMLVTETMPLPMRGTGTRSFTFDKLLNSGNSETLQQYSLNVEYTSNPAWYAVQALPYLMEYPYDCAEQTWNRYYANSLASFIASSSPRIKQVFEQWKTTDTAALLSNLQKNQELKSILLEETPWVLQAKSEAEQKKNIALLFDMIRMSEQLNSAYEKLKKMQSPNGGFVWFTGGPDDRYMTQYIVTGIGHLKQLKSISASQESRLRELLQKAIPYLDRKIKEDYDNLVKWKTDLNNYMPAYTVVQYLYMRSFFPEYKIPAASQQAYTYFRSRLSRTWTQQNKYMQGMIVLALGRTGDSQTPAAILKSLKETAINHEELGMYWKTPARSWWWYEAPIERQALLIEAFHEIGKDTKTADDLRTWLLKNKQTNRWESTKATAEACYALLLQGTSWLNNEPVVKISLGNKVIRSTDQRQQAGTGYFSQTIDGPAIRPEMGKITVTVDPAPGAATAGNSPSWGGIYWQYFEDLDKITTASTPLRLVKKLFIEKNTDRGPVLTPLNEGDILRVGDKVKVRIELKVDRDMEYVHMKDMRASALEPVNVLSSYKWQGGLGYYETTKDASTNFFFSSLQKGSYVFEYTLFATHAGNFSNGITSIQCMYAPEFASHSEGIRISIE